MENQNNRPTNSKFNLILINGLSPEMRNIGDIIELQSEVTTLNAKVAKLEEQVSFLLFDYQRRQGSG